MFPGSVVPAFLQIAAMQIPTNSRSPAAFAGILEIFEWLLSVIIDLLRAILPKIIQMNRFFKTVLLTGLFVGTMDLLNATVSSTIRSGKIPDKMLTHIAGAAVGLETSANWGNWGALLGLFFHYFISFTFTLFFFWVFPRWKFLAFNKYLVGMLYAVFVNLVMGQLVLPLTALPVHWGSFQLTTSQYVDWIVLGVVFGVPIAYNTYKYYGVKGE
jgi:hypothetical protein